MILMTDEVYNIDSSLLILDSNSIFYLFRTFSLRNTSINLIENLDHTKKTFPLLFV